MENEWTIPLIWPSALHLLGTDMNVPAGDRWVTDRGFLEDKLIAITVRAPPLLQLSCLLKSLSTSSNHFVISEVSLYQKRSTL